MRTLYPEISINHEYYIEVGDRHTLYVEECGNPNGIPVLFVHGGPGGGCGPTHRRFFNPRALSHHPVRPARLWSLNAACRARSQYHSGTGGGHGADQGIPQH